jgi:hypothetical protein
MTTHPGIHTETCRMQRTRSPYTSRSNDYKTKNVNRGLQSSEAQNPYTYIYVGVMTAHPGM